jgi:hypothetical protein
MQGFAQAGAVIPRTRWWQGAGQDSENAGRSRPQDDPEYAQSYLDYTAIDLNEK